jgi:hypothetical protein
VIGESLPCPHLAGSVELSDERQQHIARTHPDLLPDHRTAIAGTLAKPDEIRRSARLTNARLFSRWHPELRGGKHVVVVVVSDAPPTERHWIVTAYIARKLAGGEVEWRR